MSELHKQSSIGISVPIVRTFSFSRYALLVIAILILANISIKLNIPIYRQVMGVLLLLLPGLLFMRLLNTINVDTIEKILLTVGVCISMLIFIGLAISYISQNIWFYKSLSIESLLLEFDIVCILFILLLSRKKEFDIKISFPKNRLTSYDKLFLSIAMIIPVWSFWGVHIMNRYSYNTALIGLFIFVSIVILLVSLYNKKISSNIYPIIIFSISISFVLLYPSRSDHLLGMDIHSEYYLFQEVVNNLNWQLVPSNSLSHSFQLLQPCVSISLLPALFQSILQVNPETLYRLYISILFSITPLIIYVIARRYFDDKNAFLTSITFISYYSFITASYYSRATFALLLFSLFIMTLFTDTLQQDQRSIILLLFSVSMIFTHYASTFILLFILAPSSIIGYILSKKNSFKRRSTITLVLTIFAFTFLWYGMITDGIFNISVKFVQSVLTVDNLYKEDAHSDLVYQLGGEISRKYVSELNFINTWVFILLIGLGTLGLILRFKQYWFKSNENDKNMHLKKEFEPEFVIITMICVIILVMTLVLPYLSNVYDLTRIYFQTSVILSVSFIFGGKYAAIIIKKIINVLKIRNLDKNRSIYIHTEKLENIIILAVLIPHLLFVANVPQELTGNGDSIIFNSVCPTYDWLFIHDSDIYCINWWSSNRMESHNLWADHFGITQIIGQEGIENCSKITEKLEKIPETEYIYLRETNIVKNRIYYSYYITETTKNFTYNEYPLDKLYSGPAIILYKRT